MQAQLLAQEKTDRLATASHDIRQPLTSLKLTLSRLAQNGELAPPVIERFTQSLDYLDKLAREYTADDRSATQRPDNQSFSVAMLLDNLELMFREEAEGKGLAFRCRVRNAQAQGDAMAAMRLVSNLVANAIKYTARGKVLLGSAIRGDKIRIMIADTGPGIPQDEQARVLESRQRGSTVGDIEGAGLGLGIAAALAAQNNFGFEMRSTPGRGTLFVITLPRTST